MTGFFSLGVENPYFDPMKAVYRYCDQQASVYFHSKLKYHNPLVKFKMAYRFLPFPC